MFGAADTTRAAPGSGAGSSGGEDDMQKRAKPLPSPPLRLWNWAGILNPSIREAHDWYVRELIAAGALPLTALLTAELKR